MIHIMFGFVRIKLREENIQGNVKPPLFGEFSRIGEVSAHTSECACHLT